MLDTPPIEILVFAEALKVAVPVGVPAGVQFVAAK
jgi:hypothetical protein